MSETEVLSKRQQRELHSLLFAVRRSIRYHNRRRRFFDGFDKTVKVLGVVGGSAAFAASIGQHNVIAIWFAAAVAFASAISLVIGPSQAARLHEGLARRFAQLEHDIHRTPEPTADQVNGFVAERLLIEFDEPPALRVLDIICHNELCEALGYDRCHFYKVRWLQSLAAPFFDLWPSSIKSEEAAKVVSPLANP
jgi:hypothetical protein